MKKITVLLLLLASLNINAQWIQMSSGFGNNKIVLSLASAGSDIFAGIYCYPSGPSGVYRSDNCGITWTQTSLNKIYVAALASRGENLFAGLYFPSSSEGGVYLSTNRGDNWILTSLNKGVTSLAVSGNIVYAGTICDGMFISSNNGATWPKNVLAGQNVLSIAVSGANVFAGTSDSGAYYSTNSGDSWIHTSVDNQTVFSVSTVPGRVFIGTFRFGVCVSTNNGNYWMRTALDNQWVYALAALGNNVVAATHCEGVFLSSNYGVNWVNVSEGLGFTAINVLLISGSYIYAGTDGYSVWRRPLSQIVGAENPVSEMPGPFSLSQNYPNPFNPSTKIGFSVPYESRVKISVFDASGKEVSIVLNELLPPGNYTANWDGSAHSGGVYFCRLSAGNLSFTRKMMLIK